MENREMVERAYDVILKTGESMRVIRNEPVEKSLIELWKWSTRQVTETIIDFKDDLSIAASTIASVKAQGEVKSTEELKEGWEELFDNVKPGDIQLSNVPSVEMTREDIVKEAIDDVNDRYLSDASNLVYTKKYRYKFVDFEVNKGKRTVVALIRYGSTTSKPGKVIARGIARCLPEDCFNEYIGKAIALRRALGEHIPEYYLDTPQPEGFVEGDLVWMDGWKEGFTKEVIDSPDNPDMYHKIRKRVIYAFGIKGHKCTVKDDTARYK